MPKFGWLVVFFLGLPLFLLSSTYLLYSSSQFTASDKIITPSVLGLKSAFPAADSTQIGSLITGDSRPIIIRQYLKRYRSPLEPYADQIVNISDKYQLDYRLLVAIAQQESNLCHKIPADSHNCWGYGIYGDQVIRFDNYLQGLETVAKTLRLKYLDQGLNTPEEIMTRYTPPSLAVGGTWAAAIQQFLSELE